MLLNNERLPLILALLAGVAMVALTAWQGYRFWQMESRQGDFAEAQAVVSESDPAREPPSVDLSSLSLFGTAASNSVATEIDTENLPETNLRLFLRGVLAAQGDFPGSALIEDDKSKTEAYLVGDALPGNAKLRSVHPNRDIIERAGKLENLYFPESEGPDEMPFTADPGPTEQPETSTATSSAPATAISDDQRREEIRRRLEQLRERLRNNN